MTTLHRGYAARSTSTNMTPRRDRIVDWHQSFAVLCHATAN